jgi:hypothetical protein
MVQPLTVLLPGLEPHDFSGSLDNRLIAFMNSNFGLTGSSAGTHEVCHADDFLST